MHFRGFGPESTGMIRFGSRLLGRILRFVVTAKHVALQFRNLFFQRVNALVFGGQLRLQSMHLFFQTFAVRTPSQIRVGHTYRDHFWDKKSNTPLVQRRCGIPANDPTYDRGTSAL